MNEINENGANNIPAPPRFVIQQLAFCPKDPKRARKLLTDLGMNDWIVDSVHASGEVFGCPCENHALLQYNYQAGDGTDVEAKKPLELELLHYTQGLNWMDGRENSVSHIGMHCTPEDLDLYRDYFRAHGIKVAQEVETKGHTNQHIANSRRYNYVIFDTRDIIGVDLKFIVRLPFDAVPSTKVPLPLNRRQRG